MGYIIYREIIIQPCVSWMLSMTPWTMSSWSKWMDKN